ncbi:MAG: PTS system mannose/fructose/sorbose family transporter subunit IID [Desulfovibrio sp.]|nr:PTS system mannose/fructose/sorbose family transporter subunit IID [Desulfovibrio sp.]
MYPTRIALVCLARTACINAVMTSRGMQHIGMAFMLEPALRHLYPSPAKQATAFARYTGSSNTHPFLVPLYAGILLALEENIATGILPPTAVTSIRQPLATTLSALGDALFSGTLLPLWALVCVNLMLCGYIRQALVVSIILCIMQILFRISSFFYALRRGLATLVLLRQMDAINWADRLKIANALLTALALWHLPYSSVQPFPWPGCTLGMVSLLLAAWLVARLHFPRLLLWCAVFCAFLMDFSWAGM